MGHGWLDRGYFQERRKKCGGKNNVTHTHSLFTAILCFIYILKPLWDAAVALCLTQTRSWALHIVCRDFCIERYCLLHHLFLAWPPGVMYYEETFILYRNKSKQQFLSCNNVEEHTHKKSAPFFTAGISQGIFNYVKLNYTLLTEKRGSKLLTPTA